MTTSELQTLNITSISFEQVDKEFSAMMSICKKLLSTPHYRKLGEEGMLAILIAAHSINMHPFEALNGALYYVNGRVGRAAESMAAAIRANGHCIVNDSKSDDTICILHGKRNDTGNEWKSVFSIEDAARANLISKPIWKQYPRAMCYNRAVSQLFRQLFPDLAKNVSYTPEEIADFSDKSKSKDSPLAEILAGSYERISTDQAIEINDLLNLCSIEYKEKVMTHLKTLYPPVECLEDVPVDLYERIKDGAMKNQQNTLEHHVDEEG